MLLYYTNFSMYLIYIVIFQSLNIVGILQDTKGTVGHNDD